LGKRHLKILTLVVFIIVIQIPANRAYSKTPPDIYINRNPILSEVKPYIDRQYRSMVPLRVISEGLGFDVRWDASQNAVTITGNGSEIILKPGSQDCYVNGKLKKLESAPVYRNNRMMVPLRFIAETIDATVHFKQEENLIDITVGTQVQPIYYRDKVVVLLYHHIDPNVTSNSTISPETFKSHLDMLVERGFNVIPIEYIKMLYHDPSKIPPNAVVITFDDGYESFYTYAYPELINRNMVATNFLIVGRIGNKTGEIPKLDWEQLKEMQEHGMSFYSHTYDSHAYGEIGLWGTKAPVFAMPIYREDLGRLETDGEYLARVFADFEKAKLILESELGGERDMFAIPYGWYNQRILKLAEQVGYRYIFSVNSGINDKHTKATKLLRINGGHPEITAETLEKEIFKVVAY
jgi:biofilm PGA synthesis lipoprotein PgaB